MPDGTTKEAQRKSDGGLNGMFRPIAGFLFLLVTTGFGAWMTQVWASTQEHSKQISIIESRLSGIEQKMDGMDDKVDDVQDGVNKLIDLELKRIR